MRKVKIVDELDFDKTFEAIYSKDFQAAINRLFAEIADENGSIVQTTYLRGSGGHLITAIIEYEVADEEG